MEHASQAEGRIEEKAKDIDEPLDEEEGMVIRWRKAPKASQVKFPTEKEF